MGWKLGEKGWEMREQGSENCDKKRWKNGREVVGFHKNREETGEMWEKGVKTGRKWMGNRRKVG